MSGFASRWVVVQEHAVGSDDVDTGGVVRDDAVDRWLMATRDAYLERCRVFRELQAGAGLELKTKIVQRPARERLGRPTAVTVSAGATEIRPTSVTVAFRLRPMDGDGDDALNAACLLMLEDPLTGEAHELGDDVRDELIALQHGARHVN